VPSERFVKSGRKFIKDNGWAAMGNPRVVLGAQLLRTDSSGMQSWLQDLRRLTHIK
jgi:hypothetical protein